MKSELERYKIMQELINKLEDNHKQYNEVIYKEIAIEAKEQLNMPAFNLHMLSLYLAPKRK
ncbi:MAG: hypothetical protein KBD37_08600 [Burkholderiales bacterium]|nr:hypothetical protein [Burkholderiales bacterium]